MAAEGEAPTECPHSAGDTVRLLGLQGRADLNGETGVVLSFDSSTGRCCVRLHEHGREQMNVRVANLVAAPEAKKEEEEEEELTRPAKRPKVQLQGDVQALVERICNVEAMKRHVESCNFHGGGIKFENLDSFSIKQGLTWLRAIEQELLKIAPSQDSLGKLTKSCFKAVGVAAANFDSIDSVDKMKAKIDTLESLVDIESVYGKLQRIAEGRSGKRKSKEDSEPEEEGDEQEVEGKEKRLMTPYFRYLSDHREAITNEVKAEHEAAGTPGSCRLGDVAKRAAEKWKALSEEERAVYEEPYKAEKAKRDQEKAEKKAKEEAEEWEIDPLCNRQYRMLGCHLAHISRGSPVWCMVAETVLGTQAQDTAADGKFFAVDQIFSVTRASEEKHFAKASQMPNRRLLWYGGPLACWAGVLSGGLRAPEAETPFTGYNFGKGIYFSDMVSVAAAKAGAADDDKIIVLLCEVALGKSVDRHQADSRGTSKLPPGHHSVIGHGSLGATGSRVLSDGVQLMTGPVQERNGVLNTGNRLPHNEYVVYNPCNIKMRYILELRQISGSQNSEISEARSEMQTLIQSSSAPVSGKRLSKKTSADATLLAR